MNNKFLLVIFSFGLLLLSGCAAKASPPPATGPAAILQANVSTIEVLPVEAAPARVRVLVQGTLPGACYELTKEAVVQAHSVFGIILPYVKAPGSTCSDQTVPFEKVIALDTANLPAGSYQVEVNGVATTFAFGLGQNPVTDGSSSAVKEPTQNTAATAEPTQEATASGQSPIVSNPTPASTTAVVSSPPVDQPASTCVDQALFVADVTVPDYSTFQPGSAFVKTWQVRNMGSCKWDDRYRMAFLTGNQMNGPATLALPPANPGDTVNVSINLVAPTSAGGYTSNWQLINPQGNHIQWLGSNDDWIWLKINVAEQKAAAPAAAASPVAVSNPSKAPEVKPGGGSLFVTLSCISVPDNGFTNQVLDLINQERTSRGLPALRSNPLLNTAALQHSMDMSCNNFVEHYGSDGSTWFTRIKLQGYGYHYASENIASGNPQFGGNPAWVVQSNWMNSQVHRDNILNPNVKEIGVAYVYNPSATWGGYTTVDFALP